jgi:hypothetical protein
MLLTRRSVDAAAEETLKFWVPDMPGVYLRPSADRCIGPNNCVKATKATVNFRRKPGKKASGTYILEFADGSVERGTFEVRTSQKLPIQCL